MVFKALVEAIVKYKRDPDNVFALNTVNTLTRELKNDLIQAYELSQPIIDRNLTLFWESKSFLDFILKLCDIPTSTDTFENINNLKTLFNKCNQDKENLISDLDICNEGKRKLLREFEEYKAKYSLLVNSLEDDKSSLLRKLKSCEEDYDSLRRKLEDCKRDKDFYVKQLENRNLMPPQSAAAAAAGNQQQIQTLLDKLEKCKLENFKLLNEKYRDGGMTHSAAIAEQIQTLTSQLEEYRLENLKLMNDNIKLVKETTTIPKCRDEMMMSWDHEKEKLNGENNRLSSNLNKIQEELQAYKSERGNLEDTYKQLLDTCRMEKEELEKQIADLNNKNSQLLNNLMTNETLLRDEISAKNVIKNEMTLEMNRLNQNLQQCVNFIEKLPDKYKNLVSFDQHQNITFNNEIEMQTEQYPPGNFTVSPRLEQVPQIDSTGVDLLNDSKFLEEQQQHLTNEQLERENQTLKTKLKGAKKEYRENIEKIKLENKQLQQQVTNCQAYTQLLEKSLKECQTYKEQLEKSLKEYQVRELEQQQQQRTPPPLEQDPYIDSTSTDLFTGRSEEQLQREIETLKTIIENARRDHENNINEIVHEKQRLLEQKTELEQRLVDCQNSNKQYEQHIKELLRIDNEENVTSIAETTRILIEELQRKIESLNGDITTRDNIIATLRQEAESLNGGIAARDNTIVTLRQEAESLNHGITARDNTITTLRQEAESLNGGIAARDNTIATLRQEVESLRSDRKIMGDLIKTLRHEIISLKDQIKVTEQDIGNLQQNFQQQIGNLANVFNNEIQFVDEEFETLQQRVGFLNEQITSKDQDIQELEDQRNDQKLLERKFNDSLKICNQQLHECNRKLKSLQRIATFLQKHYGRNWSERFIRDWENNNEQIKNLTVQIRSKDEIIENLNEQIKNNNKDLETCNEKLKNLQELFAFLRNHYKQDPDWLQHFTRDWENRNDSLSGELQEQLKQCEETKNNLRTGINYIASVLEQRIKRYNGHETTPPREIPIDDLVIRIDYFEGLLRACIEREREHLEKLRGGNQIIEHLQQMYNNESGWQDIFMREWEEKNKFIDTFNKQCIKLRDHLNIVSLDCNNFADTLIKIYGNVTNCQNLENQLTIVQQQFDQLKKQYDKCVQDLDKSNQREKDGSNKFTKIRGLLEDCQKREKNYKKELEKYKNVESELKQAKKNLDDCQDKLIKGEKSLQDCQSELKNSQEQVESLENKLTDFENLFEKNQDKTCPENKITTYLREQYDSDPNWENRFLEDWQRMENVKRERDKLNISLRDVQSRAIALQTEKTQLQSKMNNMQKILKEIALLAPDIPSDDIFVWKDYFIQKYTRLQNFTVNFIDSNNSLDGFIQFMTENIQKLDPQYTNNPRWMADFIQNAIQIVYNLRVHDSSSLNFQDWLKQMLLGKEAKVEKNSSYEILLKQCEKLKNEMEIEEKINVPKFFDQITKCPKMRNYKKAIENQAKVYLPLKQYFDIKKISKNNIVTQIENVFKKMIENLGLQKPTFSSSEEERQLNFETHLKAYFELINNHFKRTEKKRRHLDITTFETSNEKKLVLQENWTDIQIQNLFYNVFKAHFRLKLDRLKKFVPESHEIQTQIRDKLRILESINQNARENILFDLYQRYIYYDLKILVEEDYEKIFLDQVAPNRMFHDVQESTEGYLKRLAENMGLQYTTFSSHDENMGLEDAISSRDENNRETN